LCLSLIAVPIQNRYHPESQSLGSKCKPWHNGATAGFVSRTRVDNGDSLCCGKYIKIRQKEPPSNRFQGCPIVRTLDNDQTPGGCGGKQLQMEVASSEPIRLADWNLAVVCVSRSAGLRQPHQLLRPEGLRC